MLDLPGKETIRDNLIEIKVGELSVTVTLENNHYMIRYSLRDGLPYQGHKVAEDKLEAIEYVKKLVQDSKQRADRQSSECSHFFQLLKERDRGQRDDYKNRK